MDLKKIYSEEVHDIILKRNLTNCLQENSLTYYNIVNCAPIGISVIDEDGNYEYVNPAYCKLFGYSNEELIGRHFTITSSDANKLNMLKCHNDLIKHGIIFKSEWEVKKKDNSVFFVLSNGSRFQCKDGSYKRVTFIVDLTNRKKFEYELKQRNELLEEISKNDGLTGLLNHNSIFFELEEQIKISSKNKTDLSIVMLDLDHFKEINDEYGHVVGDEVLASVGKIIKSSIRNIDFAGRYGGEEFLIVLPNTNLNIACVIADRIRNNISKVVFKGDFRVTASGGVKQYIDENIIDLVKSADGNLYKAKICGRNRIEK